MSYIRVNFIQDSRLARGPCNQLAKWVGAYLSISELIEVMIPVYGCCLEIVSIDEIRCKIGVHASCHSVLLSFYHCLYRL